MSKILVVYYSHSKATESLAEEIALLTGADIRELIPEKPYAFDDNSAAKQARSEMERGFCPKLWSGLEQVDGCTHIFIGTPNWFGSFAPPILSFLRKAGLAGKTVIPFCTHGGGGFGNIESRMANECPNAHMLPGFASAGNFETKQVIQWLTGLGFCLDDANNR
jgi:flavodoxin